MAKTNHTVSIEELRRVLSYDSDTGEFKWLARISKKNRVGEQAGYTGSYVFIRLYGILYRAHRLAWAIYYGQWPEKDIDHIDRNKPNNRIKNLRLVSDSENLFNTNLRPDNTSGHKGVSWSERDQVWRAYISNGSGKQIHLGLYKSMDEAISARKREEIRRGILT